MRVKVSPNITVKLSPEKIKAGDSAGAWHRLAVMETPGLLFREGGSSVEKWLCHRGGPGENMKTLSKYII